ncbi:laminin [Opitutaceae bacterium TAV5]|nr:laminin [Opitutaceae bacterium TAV5]
MRLPPAILLPALVTALPVFVMASTHPATPVVPAVSQWQAGGDASTSPQTVPDLGGIAPLSWTGAPALAPDAFFGVPAWRLDGKQAATAPHARLHGAMRENLTVEAWINLPSSSSANPAPLRDIVVRKQGQFSLDFFPEADGVRLRFSIWQEGRLQQVSTLARGTLDDGKWHHLAGVLRQGTIELFIDGRSVDQGMGSKTFAGGGYTSIGPSDRPLWIGGMKQDPVTPATPVTRGFTGMIAQIRLTGQALTPDQFGPRNPLTGQQQPAPVPSAPATSASTATMSLQPPSGGLEQHPGLTLLRAGSAARPALTAPAQVWRLGNWYYGQQEVLRTAPTSDAAQTLRLRIPLPPTRATLSASSATAVPLQLGLIVVNENGGALDLTLDVNGRTVATFPGLRDRTTFKQFHTLTTASLPADLIRSAAALDIELRGAHRSGGDRINLVQLALGDTSAIADWKDSQQLPALPPPPPAPDPATIAPYRLATGAPWNGIIYYSRRVRDLPDTIRADARLLQELGFTATFQDLDSSINLNSLRLGLRDNAQFNTAQTWQFDLFRNHGLQAAFNVYRLQLFTGEDFYSDLPLMEDSSGQPIGAPRYPKWMSSPVLFAPQTQDRFREIWRDLARHFVETPAYLRVRGEDGKLHPVFLLWSPFFFDLFEGHVASYDAWARAAWTDWQQRNLGSVRWPEPPRKNKTNADPDWAAWQDFRGEYVANGTKEVARIIRETVPDAWIAVLLKQHNFVQSVGKSYVSVGRRGLDPRNYDWADLVATETHRFGIYSVLADLDLARDMPSTTRRPIFIHYLVGRQNNLPARYPWTKRELVGSMLLRRALPVQYGYNERDDFAGFAWFERPDNRTAGRTMWPEVLPDIRSANAAWNALFDRAQATPPAASPLAIHLPRALYTIGDDREDWNAAIVTPHRELLRRNLSPRWLLRIEELDTHPEITALVLPDPLSLEDDETAALARFVKRGGRLAFIEIPDAPAPGAIREKLTRAGIAHTAWTLAKLDAADFGQTLADFLGTRPTLGAAALDVETGLIGKPGDQVLVAVNHAAEPRTVTISLTTNITRTVTIPAHDTAFFAVGSDATLTPVHPPPAATTEPVGPTLRDPDVWQRYREYVFLSAGEVE